VERVKNALVVPWSAVTREGDKASVRVREGSSAVARAITLGPSDEVDVVVTSGLTSGQVVLR
jgi:multidrug efflux pump subunit AcrA (membrane-fusion protein)